MKNGNRKEKHRVEDKGAIYRYPVLVSADPDLGIAFFGAA